MLTAGGTLCGSGRGLTTSSRSGRGLTTSSSSWRRPPLGRGPARVTLAPTARAAREPSTATASSSPGASGGNPWAQPNYANAFVSGLPAEQQRAWFVGILAAIAAGTAFNAAVLGPAVSGHLPAFLQVTRTSWFPLGPIFAAAGVAHFTEERGFLNMVPHTGAWGGLWQLPGAPAVRAGRRAHPGARAR